MAHGKVDLSDYKGVDVKGKISQRAQLKKDDKNGHTSKTAVLAHHTKPAKQKVPKTRLQLLYCSLFSVCRRLQL